MTIKEVTRYCIYRLKNIYEEGEAAAIAHLLIEYLTGEKMTDHALQQEKDIAPEQIAEIEISLHRLIEHEPIQYVLNEAWFYGLKFYVDRNVLIPRPETEELVDWIISDCKFPISELKILDIGSGSGCIPIALKRKLRKAEVWSCDISEAALEVARKNAIELSADINFQLFDFLNTEERGKLPSFDIIVSNPPYIPHKERYKMPSNVLEYEPARALFVPDNDPLIFYKAIADFGKTHLSKNGIIYAETHENFTKEIAQFFELKDYRIEIKKDMQGKDRMIKAKLQ